MLFMLDTDTTSYIIKKRPISLAEKFSEIDPSSICVSVVTRAELLFGLRQIAENHRLSLAVRKFLEITRVLPWTEEAADEYAEIRHILTKTGKLIGELDMMIAAHAAAIGAVLVTNNVRHFKRMEGRLEIVNWVV
jgi:tRNA(fMet)-specific endonuclease VapC